MVPLTHPLAAVRDSFNAVFVEGDAVGELMFLGRGCRRHADGQRRARRPARRRPQPDHRRGRVAASPCAAPPSAPSTTCESAYYLTLQVADRPGVLHAVSGVLGQHRVSIRLMEQEGLLGNGVQLAGPPMPAATVTRPAGSIGARLVFVTHPAYERDVQACLHDLRQLDVVERIGGLLRVVGG